MLQDPIGLDGGLALHTYTSDPLSWIDPLGLAALSSLSDAALGDKVKELMYRDKRAPGSSGGGTHGLVHRFDEQINGKMRPGSTGWATHEQQILDQQKSLRGYLNEMERRGLDPPPEAWKMATVEPPKGNQLRMGGCNK